MSSNNLTEVVKKIKEAAIIAAGTPNEPEGKLRELVSPIWNDFLHQRKINLKLVVEDELTLANGRADTVFNKLILEYKKPNTIRPDNAKNRKLLTQVEGYILDIAEERRFKKERLLGVLFDGNYFVFMRWSKGWRIDEPISISEKSLEQFLIELERLTKRIALIPENLIRDFAIGRDSRNKVAVDCIKAFYHEVNQHGGEGETKEHVFFEQWKVQFAEVHGTLEQKKIDKERLFVSYGFSKKEQKDFNVYAFFFALDSYYAVLMKLLSYQVVGFYTVGGLTGLPLHEWEKQESDGLRKKMEDLEEGGIFRSIGIRNFLEGDLFSWYTEAWPDDIYKSIKQIIQHLNDYDPETMEIAPDETRDILKKLYQYLVPKQIRHDLGEYYTPDWLADRCLNQLNYNGDPKYRILDPGCGSGTFPILAIKRAKDFAIKKKHSPQEALKNILKNIFGFDLNPLAVISARTNYMLAIADLLKFKEGEITIPIYLCDSINPPEAKIDKEMTLFPEKIPYLVKTTVGSFYFSHSIITKHRVQQLANIMEDAVKSGQPKDDFMKLVKTKLKLNAAEYEESELYLEDTYERLVELDKKGINGIWARIIKNAFAPLFVGQFDMVVGNPPWITWGSLPKEYRISTQNTWFKYDLFEHTGLDARLGKSGDDISVLMTYVSIDKYLKKKGNLCFVITQSLFQSVGGGRGFRKFRLGNKGEFFKVHQVDDLVRIQPFEGATNRTAIFHCTKSSKTEFPVQYCLWKKLNKGRIDQNEQLTEVVKITKRTFLQANPINNDEQSPWLTAKRKANSAISKVIGKAKYQARMGAHSGGANGIYWINTSNHSNGIVTIENLNDIGKNKFKNVQKNVENKFVYPLLRGKEVHQWEYFTSINIILGQDYESGNKAIQEAELARDYPQTFNYFNSFKDELLNRSHYKKHFQTQGAPFYSTYNVGRYTFSPYKVVWKYIASFLECCVIGESITDILGSKTIVPDTKLVLIPFENKNESHFVCALLNSTISKFIVKAYVVETQLAPHILTNIAVPKFDSSNSIHQDLSKLSQQCHEKTAAGIDVSDLEEQIDELAADLWGLTKDELKDIQESLEELR